MASSIERPFVAQPAVAAGGRVITSPFQFYSDGSESLRLRVWSSLVTNVGLQGRWLRRDGDPHPFRYDIPTTADRLPLEQNFPLDAGYMLNCTIGILGGTVTKIGQTFVQLALVRGRGDAGVEVGTILQGYVATSHWLGFPGSPIMHSFEGPGFITTITTPQPFAGNELVVEVPEHTKWRIYSHYAIFGASAVAGNRFPQLGLNSGVLTTLWRIQAPVIVTAGVGFNFFWLPGIPFGPAATAIPNAFQVPLPDPIYAFGLQNLRTETVGINAGDQWSQGRTIVEEWLDTDVYGAPL